MGFTYLVSANRTYYYIADYDLKRVFILNSNWSFISVRNFTFNPGYMITIDDSIYMTTSSDIYKTDKNLIILKKSTLSSEYIGIYYNSTNKTIYAALALANHIDIFDLKLNFLDFIDIGTKKPISLAGNIIGLFIGTFDATVILIVNKKIKARFNGCDGFYTSIISLVIDQYGYMANSCNTSGGPFISLYSLNGTFISLLPKRPGKSNYIGFDSNQKFVAITSSKVFLYT